jgi:hypothetical protein
MIRQNKNNTLKIYYPYNFNTLVTNYLLIKKY